MVADPGSAVRDRRRLTVVAAAGFVLYVLTGALNVGVFAHDDYVWVMKVVLPAQTTTAASVIAGADIRSPIPMLAHLGLVKIAAALGMSHPLAQMRFDQAVLGAISFSILLWVGLASFRRYDEPDRSAHRLIYAGLLGFHFAAAFILTRPMFESLSAPPLALGALAATRYHQDGRRSELLLAVGWLAVAVVLRPQAAVATFALPILVLHRRRYADLGWLLAAGILAIGLTGLVDLWLRGGWHESLRRYLAYNFAHGKDWGVDPWYRFLLVLAGLSIPPVFFARYRDFPWRARYRSLLPIALVVGLFVAAHSIVPHKEERFMIPILPLFLLLLTPLAVWLLDRGPRWRIGFFLVVNGVLLILAVTNRSQRTGMELAAWVDRNPAVETVEIGSDDILFPGAFVTRRVDVRSGPFTEPPACDQALAVLSLAPEGIRAAADPALVRAARFEPGPLEQLAIRINPRRNTRRGPIDSYRSARCSAAAR